VDALPVILVLLVVVGLAVAVAWPLLAGEDEEAAPARAEAAGDARAEVEEELRRSLQAIREIAFDRASGHLSDDDFRALDADERARAVELLRRRDALAGGPGENPAAPPEEAAAPLMSPPPKADEKAGGGRA